MGVVWERHTLATIVPTITILIKHVRLIFPIGIVLELRSVSLTLDDGDGKLMLGRDETFQSTFALSFVIEQVGRRGKARERATRRQANKKCVPKGSTTSFSTSSKLEFFIPSECYFCIGCFTDCVVDVVA